MRMLVVGAGATGGYFGGRLAQHGRDVTFLVRPARAAFMRENGLRVTSPHGDFQLEPRVVTAAELSGQPASFDVVLITVKAYSLEQVLGEVAPAVGPSTMVLPVLNGLRHIDVLTRHFGAASVVGCVCRIAATVAGDGSIAHLAKFHELAYGEIPARQTARIAALHEFMDGAGFDARMSADIGNELWEKWVFLATLGAVNCLMRASVGEIAKAPGGLDFIQRLLDEVMAVASAEGAVLGEAYLARSRATLMDPSSSLTSSMYRDFRSGGQIEADQILGDLAARGRVRGVATPLLDAVCTCLAIYQGDQRSAA